ncbi:uncharacterized protein BKA78DRAFT_94954 [Phyllosticta capitalensis]|uniref:uncharacterized protein n=1 Tax=Phyllosticta capitalensis TaxID=121624 RepID=UPI00312DC536
MTLRAPVAIPHVPHPTTCSEQQQQASSHAPCARPKTSKRASFVFPLHSPPPPPPPPPPTAPPLCDGLAIGCDLGAAATPATIPQGKPTTTAVCTQSINPLGPHKPSPPAAVPERWACAVAAVSHVSSKPLSCCPCCCCVSSHCARPPLACLPGFASSLLAFLLRLGAVALCHLLVCPARLALHLAILRLSGRVCVCVCMCVCQTPTRQHSLDNLDPSLHAHVFSAAAAQTGGDGGGGGGDHALFLLILVPRFRVLLFCRVPRWCMQSIRLLACLSTITDDGACETATVTAAAHT